jgi:hypothetical protein
VIHAIRDEISFGLRGNFCDVAKGGDVLTSERMEFCGMSIPIPDFAANLSLRFAPLANLPSRLLHVKPRKELADLVCAG